MTNHHGACCGPVGAANVHRDCPRVWVGAGGREMTCGCPHHANEVEGIALQTRGNGVAAWDNGGQKSNGPGVGALTPTESQGLDQHPCVRGSASRG